MNLRFRTAILCALLAVIWTGGLPQTSARAIHPSDLAGQLDANESVSAGVFGAYVTLTDPSTGVAVLDTMLPRGWTAQLQTNWNLSAPSIPAWLLPALSARTGRRR